MQGKRIDELETLHLLIDQASAQLSAQGQAADALDTKALAMLGLAATVAFAFIAYAVPYWWAPVVLMVVASIPLGFAAWPAQSNIGPELRRFYEERGGLIHLEASRVLFANLLFAGDQAASEAKRKSGRVKAGGCFLIAGLIVAAAVVVLHRH